MEQGDVTAQIHESGRSGRKVISLYVCDDESGKVAAIEMATPVRARALGLHLYRLAQQWEGRS